VDSGSKVSGGVDSHHDMVGGLKSECEGDDEEEENGEVGSFAHEMAKAAEVSLGVVKAPRRENAGRDEGKGQSRTEGQDEEKAQDQAFELKANEEDGEGGGAGHEAAGEAEEDDLARGDGASGEAMFDFMGVGALVGILKIDAVVFHEFVVVPVFMFMGMGRFFGVRVMVGGGAKIAAGSPEEPEGHPGDDRGGEELEVGFPGVEIELSTVIEANSGEEPDEEGMGEGGGEAEENGLGDGAADGDDEGSHHGFRMAGLKAVHGSEEKGAGEEEPGMTEAMLEECREGEHGRRWREG